METSRDSRRLPHFGQEGRFDVLTVFAKKLKIV